MSKIRFPLAEVFSTHFKNNRKYAFTLAEVFSTHFKNNRKYAFTLAEVLITLGVIGVVAALTLPSVMENVQQRIRREQVRTVQYKFTKATEKMNVMGASGPFSSTMEFVSELGKHLKLAKVCTTDNLVECWPYREIDLGNGNTFDIARATNGVVTFNKITSDLKDYSSSNVGIITADGTPMILSYNSKCASLDPAKQYPWTSMDGKPVTNATAGCVSAIFEINGGKKPNKLGEDVRLFNASFFAGVCATGKDLASCFATPKLAEPISKSECEELGLDGCINHDVWAGAVKACGGLDNMPTKAQVLELAKEMYTKNGNKTVFNPDSPSAVALNLNPPFYIWTRETNCDANACMLQAKADGYTHRGASNIYGRYTGQGHWGTVYAMCVGE